MKGSRDWDYALRIRGVTPRTLSMFRLAEYLEEWAQLIGEENRPVFGGIVQGSAVLRASVPFDRKLEARSRIVTAKAGASPAAARAAERIERLMASDGARGQVEDRNGAVIYEFRKPVVEPLPTEHVVTDAGVIDGTVVGIVGIDDTVHVRLQEGSGSVSSVSVRDMQLARQLATHFRGEPIRVHVHGTWKRDGAGVWSPHSLYADRLDELDPRAAAAVLDELAAIPGNGWATMDDPEALWRSIRGGN
jgi:hypothetical protein